MEPFRVPSPLVGVTQAYPDPAVIMEAGRQGGDAARIALSRLWLSEGIPFAFLDCPAVYEAVRSWLSVRLEVDAKEIGISGSGRVGASLAPRKLGKKFDATSDLDLFVISRNLFEDLRSEFLDWSSEFESGRLVPRNDREAKFWRDNNARGPALISRGFLDQSMIPNLDRHVITRRISQSMYLLVEKLKITSSSPRPTSASLRCYQTWASFVQQTSRNLV